MQKVKVQLIIEVLTECPDDWDRDRIDFNIQENGCIANLVETLYEEMKESEEKGICCICYRAEANVLEVMDE